MVAASTPPENMHAGYFQTRATSFCQSPNNLALENSHGNISQAARHLGVSRQTLYRKLKN
jgi:transcriptional regulator of acetoin/glycerol metabolism